MNISVGITRAKLIEELDRLRDEVVAARGEHVEVTIYGETNLVGGGDVTITFNNDDMEHRPEVEDRIFVEIDD